jgi:hypothetical protein
MAQPCTRTHLDEVTDALARLDAAQQEIRNWRAHLEALTGDAATGYAIMAVRCKNIAVNAVLDAAGHTQQALNKLPTNAVA